MKIQVKDLHCRAAHGEGLYLSHADGLDVAQRRDSQGADQFGRWSDAV